MDLQSVPARVAITIAIAASAIVLVVVDPATSSLLPPCPWRFATGWLCPGCGSARALHALFHGHLGEAWSFNPLAVMTLPVAAADYGARFAGLPHHWASTLRPWVVRGGLLALVAFAVARNI